ncbi:uncharacterized protein LOC62_06G008405 [Vanrija pseudolonga]|uniref:Uncharacterized protein n=1 Tax=Vanrija pseudolonga TaxID=143232 RepID=A0AAF0YJ12_9TREE|nr:hypothetical protein LOC62_06G008405 [Vanrija pseudolonga]
MTTLDELEKLFPTRTTYAAQLATAPQQLQVTANTVSSFVKLITKSYPRVCVFDGATSVGAEPQDAKVVLFPQRSGHHWSLVALIVDYQHLLVFEWAGMSAAATQHMAKTALLNWYRCIPDSTTKTRLGATDWTAGIRWKWIHFKCSDFDDPETHSAVYLFAFMWRTAVYPYPPELAEPPHNMAKARETLRRALATGKFAAKPSKPDGRDTKLDKYPLSMPMKNALGDPPARPRNPLPPTAPGAKLIVQMTRAHDASDARLRLWDQRRGVVYPSLSVTEGEVANARRSFAEGEARGGL